MVRFRLTRPALSSPILTPSTLVGPPTAPRRPLSSSFLAKLRPSSVSTGSSVSAAPRVRGQQRRATQRKTLRTSAEGTSAIAECRSGWWCGLEELGCCKNASGP
ncbi:hypothetical protein E2C01_024001 [Portunus trituberculatus]|uniref:Uncharacterized protein n=1 Tax=Portunus trituberculatus TaxID=210409 RepID=A0A5B7E9C4_PORTR|nr:hypothetical protein [Portunus trituberculatus]